MATIVVLNVSETRRDARVRRIAGSLAGKGHRVVVVGYNARSEAEHEQMDGFDLFRCSPRKSQDQKDMAAIERACPAAGEIVRRADPRVMGDTLRLRLPSRRELERMVLRYGRRLERRLGTTMLGEPAVIAAEHREIGRIRSMMLINLALFEEAARHAPTVVHANDLNSLLAGFMLKTVTGAKLIFDAHEIYPEQFAESSRSEIWHDFYTRLEELLLPHTDARMTVCDSIARYYERQKGSAPFVTVRNVPSIAHLPPSLVLDRMSTPRRCLYHGNYFEFRGLDEVIRAARRVSNARFVFRGFGYHEEKLRALARSEGVEDRVEFVTPVEVNEVVAAAAACDIGLNPFISVCLNTEFALPNKFFEYMMAGLALASSDLVEMRRLTTDLDLGILFDSRNIDSIADGLTLLVKDSERLDACRRNGYQRAKEELHWELEVTRLFGVYDPVAGAKVRR